MALVSRYQQEGFRHPSRYYADAGRSTDSLSNLMTIEFKPQRLLINKAGVTVLNTRGRL